jgi:DNA-binding GntR family transcriptional regulator
MEHKEKLHRTFVREEAYFVLRDQIIEGKLPSGQKLRDKDLAEQLGVSRTPIREALLRLEEEGFVQTKPNCSTIVSPIDFHNASNLYSIIWTLESLALRQAFERLTSNHIDLMQQANEQLLQALQSNNPVLAVDSDSNFHFVYIQLSQNSELCHILSGIKQKLKRLELHYFEKAKDLHLSYEEHVNIIEALKQKDLLQALHAIESNWKASFSRMQPN